MFYESKHCLREEEFEQQSRRNFAFPAHMHRSYEFLSVQEGIIKANIGNGEYFISAGEGVLVFPHFPFFYRECWNDTAYWKE